MGILKPVMVSTDKGLQLFHSWMVGCHLLLWRNLQKKIAFFQIFSNKCESPTGDALVPAKKGRLMFVKTIHGHDRITLCAHAHFQTHRVIL